jgi:hypothetical protein
MSNSPIVPVEIRKKLEEELDSSMNRALVYDRTKTIPYGINKGLRKPGRIDFETLRRASFSVHVARICINVLKEKVSKTAWVVKPIDPLATKDEKRIKEVTDFFKHPNLNAETFRTMLDKMLEDLLTLDEVCLEKTRFPDGKLAELHYVDAATIRPAFDQYGNQDIELTLTTDKGVQTLPVSYIQVLNNSQYGGPESGEITAIWPKKDFIRFEMHPQGAMGKVGYGMSPLESVLSVVANILNADNYNGTYFEEGSLPPAIIQFVGQIGQRELQQYKEYLVSQLEGDYHKPAIVGGSQELKIHNLKDISNKDMEFMEYMKFMARLLAAAYGLAGQDIGLTEDVGSKNVSETQKDLSEAKGYGSILHLFKEIFNQEIIWKDFGYEDLEFEWIAPDSTDPKEAMTMYDQALKNGAMTMNEVRQKLGLTPYGDWADDPLVLTGNGFIPVMSQQQTEGADSFDNKRETDKPEEKAGEKKEEPKEKEKVGGEKPYKEQSKGTTKSIYTPGGFECYLDDRGYSQPFIYIDQTTRKGFLIKPPVAVNLDSQELEMGLSQQLRLQGLQVPAVEKRGVTDLLLNFLPSDVADEFVKYCNLTSEYYSKKWEAKFGASRKFSYYLIEEFIDGRNLRDPLLLADMKRDPDSYRMAIEDLAKMWLVEKKMMLGDRRVDQYIITPQKRAWGIDYQFQDDFRRWDDNKDAIKDGLITIPGLQKLFIQLISKKDETKEKGSFGKRIRSFFK